MWVVFENSAEHGLTFRVFNKREEAVNATSAYRHWKNMENERPDRKVDQNVIKGIKAYLTEHKGDLQIARYTRTGRYDGVIGAIRANGEGLRTIHNVALSRDLQFGDEDVGTVGAVGNVPDAPAEASA